MVLGVKGLGDEPINVTVFFIRNCFRFFYYFLLAFNTDYTTLGRFIQFSFLQNTILHWYVDFIVQQKLS